MKTLVALLLCSGALAGCSADDAEPLSPDSEALSGLPAVVVEERLADPGFAAVLAATPAEEQAEMVQLQVASTVFCRDLHASYQNWITTGVTPEVPTFTVPTRPEDGFASFAATWEDAAAQAVIAADPEVLRSYLVAAGGCVSVVVDPAADPTTTIGDVLGAA